MESIICVRHGYLNGLIATVCLIVLLAGCGGPYPLKGNEPYTELQAVPVPRVTLGPGDDIEIQFTYAPQFNATRTVQHDGTIQLPLLDREDILIQGKTPSELRKELVKLYSTQLAHPELVVISRALHQNRVYVGGQIKEPGLVEFSGPMTALEAIMRSGGFDMRSARTKNVIIIRHKDGQRYGCALNFKDALKGRVAQPFYLQPYDIIWVPRTTIVKINQWIDQYINKMVPQTGFMYQYSTGKSTLGIFTDAYNVR